MGLPLYWAGSAATVPKKMLWSPGCLLCTELRTTRRWQDSSQFGRVGVWRGSIAATRLRTHLSGRDIVRQENRDAKGGVPAQQPVADRMKCARPGQQRSLGTAGCSTTLAHNEDLLRAAGHFERGAAGKGQQQQTTRISASEDQPRHPVSQRLGFAGAGPRSSGGAVALDSRKQSYRPC